MTNTKEQTAVWAMRRLAMIEARERDLAKRGLDMSQMQPWQRPLSPENHEKMRYIINNPEL